jgi:hypothetical protein
MKKRKATGLPTFKANKKAARKRLIEKAESELTALKAQVREKVLPEGSFSELVEKYPSIKDNYYLLDDIKAPVKHTKIFDFVDEVEENGDFYDEDFDAKDFFSKSDYDELLAQCIPYDDELKTELDRLEEIETREEIIRLLDSMTTKSIDIEIELPETTDEVIKRITALLQKQVDEIFKY